MAETGATAQGPAVRRGGVAAAALALFGAWLAITGATAEASVVRMKRSDVPAMSSNVPKAGDYVPAHTDYVLTILAGTGEANAIVVRRDADAFVVRDGALAGAGAGCSAVDPFTVRCPTPPGPGAAFVRREVGGVELGDGDDSYQGPTDLGSGFEQGTVDAGAGADVVDGAANALGGPGDDRLAANTADGGPGDDRVRAGQADGGDGRDVLSPLVEGTATRLRGGAGDDVLVGGSAGDELDGGAGADRLQGGTGDDTLDPGPGADDIDGGDGADTASFAYATSDVHADLSQTGPIDPTGEGDALIGIESLAGGAGDDALRGDDGVNRLSGGGGRDALDGGGGGDVLEGGEAGDVLTGGDGDDILIGGAGADRLDAGAGDDDLAADEAAVESDERGFLFTVADDAPDTLAGGLGRDVLEVSRLDRADAGGGDDVLVAHGRTWALACGGGTHDVVDTGLLVPRDCERVRVLAFGASISARLRLRGATVAVLVPAFLGPEEPTRVTLALRIGRRVIGRGRRVVPDGGSRFVRVRIGPSGRRALRASRSVRLDVTAADSTSTERDVLVLRAPR